MSYSKATPFLILCLVLTTGALIESITERCERQISRILDDGYMTVKREFDQSLEHEISKLRDLSNRLIPSIIGHTEKCDKIFQETISPDTTGSRRFNRQATSCFDQVKEIWHSYLGENCYFLKSEYNVLRTREEPILHDPIFVKTLREFCKDKYIDTLRMGHKHILQHWKNCLSDKEFQWPLSNHPRD